jgi:acetate kinase
MAAPAPDPGAREAVELFVYRIGRALGSLAVALGGLDALVFTGGIGEHAAPHPRPGVRAGGVAGRRVNQPGRQRISPAGNRSVSG